MRVVLDTNVLIDSTQDPFNAASRLLEAAVAGKVVAVATAATEREYHKIMRRLIEKAGDQEGLDDFVAVLESVSPKSFAVTLDDEEDYKFIQAAVGGQADIIVTSDKHLLDVGEVDTIRIVRPAEALAIIESNDDEDSPEWAGWVKGLGIGCLVLAAFAAGTVRATKQDIAALDKKIEELTAKHAQAAGEAAQTEARVSELQRQLEAAHLEVKRTRLTIEQVDQQQTAASGRIGQLTKQINQQREQLRALVRALYEQEQQSLVRLFFDTFSLSDVLSQRAATEQLQQQLTKTSQEVHSQIEELTAQQQHLRERQDSLSQLQGVLSVQEQEVAGQTASQQQQLKSHQAQAATYDTLLAEAKQAREEIAKKIFSLKSSHVEISLTNATDMAKYASSLTGVRPALLMAVLRVESNLGSNVGIGHYPEDMQPASREAFVRITDKLKLDRSDAPIARRPATGSGWGGAIGPAQIMPATWETLEPRLEALTKKSPVNPYDLSDAFVATGVFLADRGASGGGEAEALAKYVAGPYWEYHLNGWYVKRVLAVAAEYDKEFTH